MATTCPTCGRESGDDAAFCAGCGGALGGGPAPSPVPHAEDDARNLAMLAHLSALVGFLGVPSLAGPLVVWLWQRQGRPFVAEHAREALNFNLSVLLYAVAGAVVGMLLTIVTLGIGLIVLVPVALAAVVAWVILVVVATMAASKGQAYRYPLTIRFVR